MKTAKLVTGILSIILFVFVTFQSCAAGVGNALSANGEVSGTAGVMVAVCLQRFKDMGGVFRNLWNHASGFYGT